MGMEGWLIKLRKSVQRSFDSALTDPSSRKRVLPKKSSVGILSFQVAEIMSKLLQLWHSLSAKKLCRLRRELICLEGVRKIVSVDDSFLLGLACAEMVENVRIISKSISWMSRKCSDPNLRCFDQLLNEFANRGRDPHNWLLCSEEMEISNMKLDNFITLTSALHREMNELALLENTLKTSMRSNDHTDSIKEQTILDLQQRILQQKQQVKCLKTESLWFLSFDCVIQMLARYVFTVLERIKLVFGVGKVTRPSLPRNLSGSALVYPSENMDPTTKNSPETRPKDGFFELNFKILKPPSTTLGAAALALRYANLIIVLDKIIKSPQLIGIDARDDLYSMLPNNIRLALRTRLKGVAYSASDPILAAEWREAMHKILGWLLPLARNMIKLQSERSFEKHNLAPKTNVLLLQTLYFASLEKTEAAITELLIGLNYIWRFEKALHANMHSFNIHFQ